MKSIKSSFIKHFDKETAAIIEKCAEKHSNGVNSQNVGSDPFKWALTIAIGYQCFEKDNFREYHGFAKKHTYEKIKSWIKKYGHLDTHDGDCDYISLFAGIYNDFMPVKKK